MSVDGVITKVVSERLTYLDEQALRDLSDRVHELEAAGRPGDIIEAGCALGGSALALAAAKSPERRLLLYDVFGQIPPPTPADGEDVRQRYATIASGLSEGIGGDEYYGYQPNLTDKVRQTFARYGFATDGNNVTLIEGTYEETLMPSAAVALAHIDCDWYQSVSVCLNRIVPWLVPGGVLVVDDYDTWSGARAAVDEFFDGRPGFSRENRSRLHVVRTDE